MSMSMEIMIPRLRKFLEWLDKNEPPTAEIDTLRRDLTVFFVTWGVDDTCPPQYVVKNIAEILNDCADRGL